MKQTYLKVLTLFSLLIITTTYSKAQEVHSSSQNHNHSALEHNGKRIKIINPSQTQLQTIATTGIDLKCGASFMGTDLILELSNSEVAEIESQGVPFTTIIEDTRAYYQELNEVDLPKAKQELELLKAKGASQEVSRSVSTVETSISNIIQYEGESEVNWQTPQNFELGSMNGCLTYNEMLAELDRMRQLYPHLISVRKDASLAEDGSGTPIKTHGNQFTNGGQYDTWEPQTIYYVRISDNPNTDEPNEPESFYSGMTHSREVSSMMNIIYYMWYVLENYESDADIKNLVDNHEMYFVPVANPDGLLWNEQTNPNGGGLQRKNLNPSANTGNNSSRGVDLNRNYEYFWGSNTTYTGNGAGSSGTPSSNVYRGATPFSEPETQIVRAFTANHETKTALNHHATSNLLPHAYNAYPGSPSSGREDDYVKFCHDLTHFNRYIYGEAPNILTVANGDMSDWMLGGAPDPLNSNSVGSGKGILALAPENGDPTGAEADSQYGTGFWPLPSQIVSIAARATRMNLVNALYAGKLAQLHDETPSNITSTTGDLKFGIEYLGMTASPVTLTVTPVSSNITSIGTVPTLNINKQEQADVTVTYSLDNSIASGDTIEYEVTLSNDTHIIYQATIQKTYQTTTLFAEDVNPLNLNNWTSSGTSGEWVTTSTSGFENTRGITFDATPPYANNKNVNLTLNQGFDISDLSKTTLIQFYAKWDLERSFDYVQLQGRDGNTGQWMALSGKYTKPGTTLGSNRYSPASGSGGTTKSTADRENQPGLEPVFEGFKGEKWVLEEIEISPAANTFLSGAQDLQLRFVFDSDSSNNDDGYTTSFAGFSFDEFKILSIDNDRSCIAGTSPVNHEDFEVGLGAWTQNVGDDGNLSRGSGNTPDNNTGPSVASQGTYYYFAEATDNTIGVGANAEVIITSPCIDWNGGLTGTFDFDYHMRGSNTGSLIVEAKPSTSNNWTTVFSRNGAQSANGTDWKNGSVNLNAYTNQVFQLRFRIITGNGALSDIAIDNLRIDPNDTTSPTAVCQDVTIGLGYDGIAVLQANQIENGSTDNIGIETYTLDIDTFDCSNIGTNTVTLTVTDYKGNTDTCTATVAVVNDEAPIDIVASNIFETTATISWFQAESSSYRVRFRESGTTTWTASNVTTNSIDLTGLTGVTTYDVQVRTNCAGGNSPYSDIVNFTTSSICPGTEVTPTEVAPYTESFETGFGDWTQINESNAAIDIDWTRISGLTPSNTGGNPADTTGPDQASDGSVYIYTEASGGDNNKTATLESPCINLLTPASATLTFDYHRFGADIGNLKIDISADGGANWNTVLTRTGAQEQTANADPFTTVDVSLNAYVGEIIKVRIIGETGDSFASDIAVDNIIISVSNDFIYDAGTWSPFDPSGLSTIDHNIQVLSGTTALTANTFINNVTVSPGATLDLGTTTLSTTGNITNTGALTASDATVELNGTSAQSIFGNEFELGSLTLNNPAGALLFTPLKLTTLLTLTNGQLNTSNLLTLGSDVNGTAMVDVITGGSIVGNVTTERYIPARRAFRLLSSSVTSTTSINTNWQEGGNNTGINYPADNVDPNPGYGTHITGSTTGENGFDATGSGNPSLFALNNGAQAWEAITNTDVTTLTAGTPLRLMVRGDRSIDLTTNTATPSTTTLRSTGTLATATIQTTGADLNHNAGAFNFIGNPYQASVNVNDVLTGSNNIKASEVWVWDATLGARGQYVTVLLDGTGSSNGATSKSYHYIQPGQSFFTATENTVGDNSTSIVFNETDKAVGNDVTVFNNNATTFASSSQLIAKLYRTDRYGTDAGLQDNFVILYDNNYSNELTNEDVSKFYNIDENMGILKEGTLLSVDKLAMPTENDEVQLYNALYRVSNYTLDITVNGFNEVTPYLEDTYTGELTMLENGLNTITFSVDETIDASIDATRFKIVYQAQALSTEGNDAIDFAMYPNPVTDGTLSLTATKLAGLTVDVTITNLLGQQVIAQPVSFTGATATLTNLHNLKAGVYILSITSQDTAISHRIVIQ